MDRWVEERQLQVHFVSAAGLVYRDGKILLIRSARRGWEIPGGVVEQGETVLDWECVLQLYQSYERYDPGQRHKYRK